MNQIETPRLLLCKMTSDDAEFIFQLLNSPTWLQHIGDKGIKTIDDARNYISEKIKNYEQFGFGMLLVKLKSDEKPIGVCGVWKRETLDDADIGFAFLPEYNGNGYAFEAASASMNYAVNELKLKKILAITTEDNVKSIRLLKKIGMSFEKMIKMLDEEVELMLFAK